MYWLQGSKDVKLDFSAKIDGKTLKKLVKECDNHYIYIGVKGGIEAVKKMNHDISTRYYEIEVTTEPPNKNWQWFSGEAFLQVIK